MLVVLLAVVLLPHAWADPGGRLNLVIAIDLTKSVDVAGPDGKTEFQKNINGVTGILAKVPVGTRLRIIGITDHSFAQPCILMSASISDDPGYFGERLSAARNRLVNRWKARSAGLTPAFRTTDVLGALMLASQVFAQGSSTDRSVLVFFSDMRNSTLERDLEQPQILWQALTEVSMHEPICPKLRGAEVHALGVDGTGKSLEYWQDFCDVSGQGALKVPVACSRSFRYCARHRNSRMPGTSQS